MANPSNEKMEEKMPQRGEDFHKKTCADTFIQDFSRFYMSQECSDITLLVAGERIFAHKLILTARSSYFRAMFFGGLQESTKNEIELKDVTEDNLPGFKILLQYLYCGLPSLEELTLEILLDITGFANLYNCTELEEMIANDLVRFFSEDNILAIYSLAASKLWDHVTSNCLDYMDKNAKAVLKQSEFNTLTHDCVKKFISRDSIRTNEFTVFQAVQAWIAAHPDVDSTELSNNVRLHLLTTEHILIDIEPSGLFSHCSIVKELKARCISGKFKGNEHESRFTMEDLNVTDMDYGAEVLIGMNYPKEYNLFSSSKETNGYTQHVVKNQPSDGILIKLSSVQNINHIKMVLHSISGGSAWYSYFIEVSTDQKSWTCVVNHREYSCFGLQDLYFKDTLTRYIRIVGTSSMLYDQARRVFSMSKFTAYHMNNIPQVEDGFVAPKNNVATFERGACITNSEYPGITLDFHKNVYVPIDIKSGQYIQVQLRQPYAINSIRFHIPTTHIGTYIITSVESGHREFEVANMTTRMMTGQQNIRLETARVMSVIMIQARETSTGYLGCANFECFFTNTE